MPTDLGQLVPILVSGTGYVLETPKALDLLINAVPRFNAEVPTQVGLAGTQLSRNLNTLEARYLLLCSMDLYLMGKMITASDNAFNVSNVAGKVDTTAASTQLAKRRQELLATDMEATLRQLKNRAIAKAAQAFELGETLDFSKLLTQIPWNWSPYW